jgi:hypothetical protein
MNQSEGHDESDIPRPLKIGEQYGVVPDTVRDSTDNSKQDQNCGEAGYIVDIRIVQGPILQEVRTSDFTGEPDRRC